MTETDQTPSVLESLLRRMRSSGDFPALSTTISEINKIVGSDNSSSNSLTKVILQDFSLTNKLLKLVNTVSYGQFGGKINTISKAVVILGFDAVRNVATTLILIDFLQNKSQAEQLTDEVISAFFAGLIARQLSTNLNMRNHEEAMICGIFYHLGKLLTAFYFYEESQQVNHLIDEGMTPNKASYQVLGISYNDLGMGIAKSWNFPSRLLSGMQGLPNDRVGKPLNELDQLNITVNLASELTVLVASAGQQDKTLAIKQLVKKYEQAVKIDEKQLNQTLEQGMQEMAVRASILNIRTKKSPLLKRVADYTGTALQAEKPSQAENVGENMPAEQAIEADATESIEVRDTESILQAGIQDVTNTLVSDYKLNDVLQMVLEAMYRGMGFNRILMLVRDIKTNTMQARSGFGEDIEALLPNFNFSLRFAPDVFHLAIEKGVDIVIEDVAAESIASKIPDWYSKVSQAKSFLLLPVMVNSKAVGCFYADMKIINSLDGSSKNLSLLRTLRNQAVLAIKQNR